MYGLENGQDFPKTGILQQESGIEGEKTVRLGNALA